MEELSSLPKLKEDRNGSLFLKARLDPGPFSFHHRFVVGGLREHGCLFLGNPALMIPKEGTPGTTAEHEGLHECAFGLDSVVQIVSGPRLKHLCQRDGPQLGMLCGPSQVLILYVLEQDQIFLTRVCECSRKLLRRL